MGPTLSTKHMRSMTIHLVMRHRHRVRTFGDRTSCQIATVFLIPSASNGLIRVGTRLTRHLGAGRRTGTFLRAYGRTAFAVRSVAGHPVGGDPTTPFAASALRRRTTHGLNCAMTRAVVLTRGLCRTKFVACVHASSMGLSRCTARKDGRTVVGVVNRECMRPHRFAAGAGKTRRTRRTVHPACVRGTAIRTSSRRGELCSLV